MKFYIILGIVFLISLALALFLPAEGIVKSLYATPSVLALVGIVYQAVRDQSAHERNLELQVKQQIFNIGATSHMANVAFDKHVEFCEKYMAEVHKTVTTMFKEGPTPKTMEHAQEFHLLRQEYAAWLTEDINENLFPFEQALRSLGADTHFVNTTINSVNYQEHRTKKVEKMYKDFKALLDIDKEKEPDPVVAVESVKKKVRKILDIEDLVQLRKTIITEATKSLKG